MPSSLTHSGRSEVRDSTNGLFARCFDDGYCTTHFLAILEAEWLATCDIALPIYNHLRWYLGLNVSSPPMVNLDTSTVTVLVPGSVSVLLLLGHLQLHQVGLVMLLILLLLREFVAWNALSG